MNTAVATFGAIVRIPNSFQIHGHSFHYYLQRNNVDVQVRALPGEVEYWFPSNDSAEKGTRIWYNLTGCKELGQINEWQHWGQFK